MKTSLLGAIVALTFSTASFAQSPNNSPQGWMWGVGVAASQDVYTDFDNRIVPIPIIGYVGERLRVYGPFVGYQLLQDDGFTLDAQLVPIFAGYEEDDSAVFNGMEDRDFSFGAGLSLRYAKNGWTYELASNADILGTFNGYQATASIGKAFRTGPFVIEPSVGVTFQDNHYVDYYYGVTASEATATRAAYTSDSAVNTELALAVSTPIFWGGMTRFQIGATFYDDSISDSPLTDSDSAFNAMLMFSRFF